MTDSTDDMHRRGMLAAACVIGAAGSQPYDSDGQLLVPAEPTLQDWQAELDGLDRDQFTDVECEEYLDGWADVMGRWQELVEKADDATDATRQVAGELLEEAGEADEPASPLQAARTLLGHSRVEMAGRMGVPTTGHQAPTLRQWERAERRPQWEGRKKIRAYAQRLLAEAKIDDAIREDLDWLRGDAQELDAWQGTAPSDVGVLDLGDQSATRLALDDVTDGLGDEAHDELLAYAERRWEELA